MLELLLIDELERIGKKDLATRVYTGGVTEDIKKEIYPIFLSILTDEERKYFGLIDGNIKRIERRLSRKGIDKSSLNYYLLSNDLDVLQSLKRKKIAGEHHLKDANNKYLACAITSCLKGEEETRKHTM